MNELEILNEKDFLSYMGQNFVSALGKPLKGDPVQYVIEEWIVKKDRIQYLLKSKINGNDLHKITGLMPLQLQRYKDLGIVYEIEPDAYVLTLKGMLICLNIIKSNNFDILDITDRFFKTYFEKEIRPIKRENIFLNPTEKIWLFSMLVLCCFDNELSIDILNNKSNKHNYVELYNKIGDFLKSIKIVDNFVRINEKEEFLRRELEHINKKIYNINFSKERKNFFININSNPDKINIITYLFKKIFENKIKLKYEMDILYKFITECKPYLYKFERENNNKVKWDSAIDEAIGNLLI